MKERDSHLAKATGNCLHKVGEVSLARTVFLLQDNYIAAHL